MSFFRFIRSMRRICRKRRFRSDVVRILFWFFTVIIGIEVISTKMFAEEGREGVGERVE